MSGKYISFVGILLTGNTPRLLESKRLSQLEFSLEEARINTNLPPLAPSRVIPDIEFTALAANLCGILVPRIWGLLFMK